MNRSQRGSHALIVLIVIAVIGIIVALAWVFVSNMKGSDQIETTSSSQVETPTQTPALSDFIWRQTENGWEPTETPPACPDQPMLQVPADLDKVTSMLYPGQTRGGNYKPHGGFRFDTTKDNTITVTAPMEGYLIQGTRFIAQPENEIQYSLIIMNNCGVSYIIGHLRELAAKFQAIVETFPEANESSAVQNVNPRIYINQGEVLATKVGIISTSNTFFDFGVFDRRSQNEASKSSAYQAAHAQAKDTTWYAVCWLQDWLPANDVATIAKLSAGDPASGKSSDYCK